MEILMYVILLVFVFFKITAHGRISGLKEKIGQNTQSINHLKVEIREVEPQLRLKLDQMLNDIWKLQHPAKYKIGDHGVVDVKFTDDKLSAYDRLFSGRPCKVGFNPEWKYAISTPTGIKWVTEEEVDLLSMHEKSDEGTYYEIDYSKVTTIEDIKKIMEAFDYKIRTDDNGVLDDRFEYLYISGFLKEINT
jgi:hypothetical protein